MNPAFAAISALLNGLTSAVLGSVVFLRNPRREANWSYGLFCLSVALWSYSYFRWQISADAVEALFWCRALMLPAIFIPIFYAHHILALFGPERFKKPTLIFGYVFGAVFAALGLAPQFVEGVSPKLAFPWWPDAGPLYHVFLPVWFAFVLFGVYIILRNFREEAGIRRDQLRYVLVATVIGWSGGATNFPLWYDVPVPPVGNILVSAYVGLTAYAIVRYRLMDINLAITRTTVFMAVYALALGLPLLAALSLQPGLERTLGPRWWIWLWVACAVLATGAHYVNLFFQRFAENRLLKEQRRYQATLRQASEGMTRIRQLPRLLKLTVNILSKAMGLTYAAIYLVDAETNRYVRQVRKGKDGERAPDELDPSDPLVHYLLVHKNAVVAEELHLERRETADPGLLREVETTLRRLGASLVIPSFVHDNLLGFVVMGGKRSGRIYTDDDIKVLMTLASQAGLAIENARFWESERVRQAEMFHTAQLASLGTMAGSMGHQINNRFNQNSVLAGTLREAFKSADLTDVPDLVRELIEKGVVTLDKIEKNAIRGGDIVRTLLNFSKPGKMERAAFPEILEMSKDLAQYRVKFEEFDYEAVLANPLPTLNANKNQLAEVFFNLLSNAYDAIKLKEQAIQEGKLSIPGHVYRGKVAITGTATHRNGAEWLQTVVHDNGVGIKEEDLSRLFVPFFTTKATSQKGTGLGLYVIKRIVENHGGRVEVNSIYGQGTTFTILLPAFTERE